MVDKLWYILLSQNHILVVKDGIFELFFQEVLNWGIAVHLSQLREVQAVAQVIVVSSSAQELLGALLSWSEIVLLECAVGWCLKVLVLDVLQEGSLLGGSDIFGAGLEGLGLGFDAVNDIFGSVAHLIHQAGVAGAGLASGKFVVGAWSEFFATKSGVVHQDGLKVFEGVLAWVSEDSKVIGRVVQAGKGEASVGARDVESSEEGIFEVIELKDESVVVLEVEDAQGSNGTEDGGIATKLLDFSFFEEEGFNTLGGAG